MLIWGICSFFGCLTPASASFLFRSEPSVTPMEKGQRKPRGAGSAMWLPPVVQTLRYLNTYLLFCSIHFLRRTKVAPERYAPRFGHLPWLPSSPQNPSRAKKGSGGTVARFLPGGSAIHTFWPCGGPHDAWRTEKESSPTAFLLSEFLFPLAPSSSPVGEQNPGRRRAKFGRKTRKEAIFGRGEASPRSFGPVRSPRKQLGGAPTRKLPLRIGNFKRTYRPEPSCGLHGKAFGWSLGGCPGKHVCQTNRRLRRWLSGYHDASVVGEGRMERPSILLLKVPVTSGICAQRQYPFLLFKPVPRNVTTTTGSNPSEAEST